MSEFRRIVIVGPESTGKSQLASQLANHFNCPEVDEFAREYIDKLDRPYEKEDLLKIAKGQLQSEAEAAQNASNLLICDTNLIVIKIWSDHKYGRTDPWIETDLKSRFYDLYLLTNIDLPWEEDPQREHPHLREHLFNTYRDYLINNELPFEVVSGQDNARLNNAINLIESHFDF